MPSCASVVVETIQKSLTCENIFTSRSSHVELYDQVSFVNLWLDFHPKRKERHAGTNMTIYIFHIFVCVCIYIL